MLYASLRDKFCVCLRLAAVVGLRRVVATYLLSFLGVVAFASHRHLNSFEDLVSDGRSDSGVFIESGRLSKQFSGPGWTHARVVDDDPCLACFHNDWATEPIEFLALAPEFRSVCIAAAASESLLLPALVRSRRSRAPPALA